MKKGVKTALLLLICFLCMFGCTNIHHVRIADQNGSNDENSIEYYIIVPKK